jgi:hypothetical protein
MPTVTQQSHRWKALKEGGSGKALLFVHGIGNARPGDYDYLLPKLKSIAGKDPDFPVYFLYYDAINDWFKEKTQVKTVIESLAAQVAGKYGIQGAVAEVVSEYLGDILWPVLSASARDAVLTAFLAQMQRIVLDGIDAGFPPDFQELNIVCHSLGCFHTYEALHAMVRKPEHHLHPVKDGVRFQNVIFMASPVKLIRSSASALSLLVKDGLACTEGNDLSCSSDKTLSGQDQAIVKHWAGITGALDPVGGHWLRKKIAWAYMDVPSGPGFKGQESWIDSQDWLKADSDDELRGLLWNSLAERKAGRIPIQDPHSWGEYIVRHGTELKGWLGL